MTAWPPAGDPAGAVARRLAEPADPARSPARRLAAVLRALVAEAVTAEVTDEALERAAADLDRVRGRLAGAPRRPSHWAAPAPDGRHGGLSDWSPVGGAANPLAPPLTARVEDGVVVGEVTWGAAAEGPPGCVHGGLLAAAFDEVLGITQSLSGQFGMTGTLSVRYRRPTRLHVPVRLEGRLVGVEGRKVRTEGTALVDGEVTATAEGLFIALDPARFAGIAGGAPGADRPGP